MVKHKKISKKFLVSQKSQSDFLRCPYCKKELTENEMYCWHCEADLTELKNKREKPGSEDDH